MALFLGRNDTTFIPPSEAVDDAIDSEIKIVFVHDETLRPAASERQNAPSVPLVPERLREPHGELAQRFPLPRGIGAANIQNQICARALLQPNAVLAPRAPNLEHTAPMAEHVPVIDDVGSCILRHVVHDAPPASRYGLRAPSDVICHHM